MTHIMVDLETMSLCPNAALVSIGAVAFNKEGLRDKFYINIDLTTSVLAGLHLEPETVKWWLAQDKPAQEALLKNTVSLSAALYEFTKFVAAVAPDLKGLWGNGASADNVWLANAYAAVSMATPWSYKNDRCYRTIKSLLGKDESLRPMNQDIAHHALSDAVWQAEHLIAIDKVHNILD